MAAIPALPVITGGAPPTSTFAQIVAALQFVLNPPLCVMRQNVVQSLTSGTWTALTFDITDTDQGNLVNPAGQHSIVTNTTRFTAVWPGQYLLDGAAAFTLNATGVRGARWAVNGTAVGAGTGSLDQTTAAAFGPSVGAPGQLVFLNIGDFVELQAFQNSGGALNTASGSVATITFRSA